MSKLLRVKPSHIPDEEWERMERERIERLQIADRDFDLRMRITQVHRGDEEAGVCRWCNAELEAVTLGGVERRAHPKGECPGPPYKCDVCGTEWRGRDGCPNCAAAAERAASTPRLPSTIDMRPVRRAFGEKDD